MDGERGEGFVVLFDDGTRVKFKGESYLRMHRLVSRSWKRIIKSVEEREWIPDFGSAGDKARVISEMHDHLLRITIEAFYNAPGGSRKADALWIMKNHPEIKDLFFALLDGKPIEPLIFKHIAKSVKG